MTEKLNPYQITESDIEDLAKKSFEEQEAAYLYEQEHSKLMNAYRLVLENIGYYTQEERQQLAIQAIATFMKEKD